MPTRKLPRPFLVAVFVLLLSSWSSVVRAQCPDCRHEPITQELITLVDHDVELKKMLVRSIDKAKVINSDRNTNPAQTLDEYYRFIDWAAKAMPWTILPSLPAPKLFEQIDQSLDYFYFINDQPLEELKDKGYYNNSLQYHEPYRTWLIQFTKNWGIYLSQYASWNDAYYKKALDDQRFGLQNGWYEDPSHWLSFNDFFARYLKSPDKRPINAPGDTSVVVSPADSVPQGVWAIDRDSNIVVEHGKAKPEQGVRIKSTNFKSIPALLGPDSAYQKAFANGTLTHTFLNVNDYHRYHFPVGGVVKEVRRIAADDAAGGITKWDGKKYVLESTEPGWQSIETRGVVIIETKEYGVVALLPIGMSQVSSVNFEASVKVGTTFKKGDMLGWFLFGGSDFVIIFQDRVRFSLTVPPDQHVLMGEKYGKLTLKK
jgi:phosphatidylserine decarboxylase precursor